MKAAVQETVSTAEPSKYILFCRTLPQLL